MRKSLFVFLILFSNLFISCQVEPKPIEYGSDACSFCSMTIVDHKHASEIVTGKGKAFKYDSIECMMRDLKNFDQAKVAFFLVNDFANPGNFINAVEATYLISENIPSPMGENLSAFKEINEAKKVQSQETGETFTWQELQKRF